MKLFNITKVKQNKVFTQNFYMIYLKNTYTDWVQKDIRNLGGMMKWFLNTDFGGSCKTKCQNSKNGTLKMGGFYCIWFMLQ